MSNGMEGKLVQKNIRTFVYNPLENGIRELSRMDKRKITEITRRNISDAFALNRINWSGRLEEQDFLARIYDLKSMPSSDPRYSDASSDIWMHRTRFNDWEDDWIFTDSRFDLLRAPDDEYLRFLCEVIHPAVQWNPEHVETICTIINEHLRIDGLELCEVSQISGRPVFEAREIIEAISQTKETAKIVTQSVDKEYLSRQVARMQAAVTSDPDVAIGTAKELIETICKTILSERNEPFSKDERVPRLVRQVAGALELIPSHIEFQSAEIVKRMLSNLASVADGIAELRNLHGTGHGKHASAAGLESRHARLAVGAATCLVVFLWESHKRSSQQDSYEKVASSTGNETFPF